MFIEYLGCLLDKIVRSLCQLFQTYRPTGVCSVADEVGLGESRILSFSTLTEVVSPFSLSL